MHDAQRATPRLFQSTLPRGERRTRDVLLQMQFEFQSTLPRGERHDGERIEQIGTEISIHAPAWGATFRQ